MKVSIVIPCYNEEKNIELFYTKVFRAFTYLDWHYEMIFIDDGSKDQTEKKIKEIAEMDPDTNYITFSRNFGKEAAMLAGLQYASGDYVLIMDSDLQHPPELIPKMLDKALEGYDQVIAKRDREGEQLHRSLLSKLYYFLVNRLIDVKLNDGQGDFRLLSRKAVDSLLQLQEYNRFSKGLFSWIGYKQAVISYKNVQREEGKSAWTFKKLLNYGIDGIVSFNNKPLRVSIYIGFVTFIVSCLYLLFIFQQIIREGVELPGYFTTICAILIMGGMQLIFMGIIGEYIGRIYYESKKRPHYIIEESNVNAYKKNSIVKDNKRVTYLR